MKPSVIIQVIHACVTALLFVALLIVVVLFVVGKLESRPVGKEPAANVEHGKAKAKLVVVRGTRPNETFLIFDGRTVIGRADKKPVDVDLSFQETPERIWSSREHALIISEDGALLIEDLNSTNGTFVNRERLNPGQKQPLKANDTIQIGEVHLRVQ